jgi:hypothetical protein
MEKRQVLAILAVIIMITSTLGYSLLSAPPKTAENTPVNFYTFIPGVDFSGLTELQKLEVLRVLKREQCTCGCGYGSLAACRNLDPTCSYSLARANAIVASYLEENEGLEGEVSPTSDRESDAGSDVEKGSSKIDTDNDGIPDELELRINTDPLEKDTVEKIEQLKLELANARIEGRITEEEFFLKLNEYNRAIALLENIPGEKQ